MSDPLQHPFTLPCGAVLPNRIGKSAMTEGLADARLHATAGHQRLYRRWSQGGTGLLITGNVQIDRRVLERPGNVAIDSEEGRDELRAWAKAGTVNGNHLWMQISHAGRQSPRYVTTQPLAPSPVRLKLLGNYATPRGLTNAEIEDFIGRFAYVAKVAKDTGFTGVQLHAAHGYLLSSFLSPIVNRRTDKWGGNLENRARFLLDAIRATRAAVGPEFPIGVKLNSADFQRGGFSHEDSLQVAKWLNDESVDLLEISGGSYEQPTLVGGSGREEHSDPDKKESTRDREAYFLEYARDIRKVVDTPLMVTGGFRSREVMQGALEGNDCDVIGLARPLCTETDFPRRLFEGTTDIAPRHELNLKIGSGRFGWNANSFTIKLLNVFGHMGWYYIQLLRLGAGQEPNLKLSALGGLLGHLKNELKTAWRIRKFQKEVPGTREA